MVIIRLGQVTCLQVSYRQSRNSFIKPSLTFLDYTKLNKTLATSQLYSYETHIWYVNNNINIYMYRKNL